MADIKFVGSLDSEICARWTWSDLMCYLAMLMFIVNTVSPAELINTDSYKASQDHRRLQWRTSNSAKWTRCWMTKFTSCPCFKSSLYIWCTSIKTRIYLKIWQMQKQGFFVLLITFEITKATFLPNNPESSWVGYTFHWQKQWMVTFTDSAFCPVLSFFLTLSVQVPRELNHN